MKSLTVITIVVSLTWPIATTIQRIAVSSQDSKAVILLRTYVLVMINAGIAANYFILYAFRYVYTWAGGHKWTPSPHFSEVASIPPQFFLHTTFFWSSAIFGLKMAALHFLLWTFALRICSTVKLCKF